MKIQNLLFIFLLTLFTVSCNQKVEKSKKNIDDFVNSCMMEAKTSYGNDLFSNDDIQNYCKCAADKALGEFTAKEIDQLDDYEKHPELQVRLEKIIEPCINDLAKKSNIEEKQAN